LQWLQDPSEINGDNINNVRHEASRHFRNKMREYLKEKINELATKSKNKNIRDLYRGINEFRRSYQPRNNLLKDENSDLLVDSHNILNRWKNYFSQLFNVHNVCDVRQIEVYTAEPLVLGPSRLKVEIAIAKLKKYKSQGSDQNPAELIQGGGELLLSVIHKLINSVCHKEESPDQWKEFIIVPVQKKGDKTDCITYCWISLLSTSCTILSNILLSRLGLYIDEIIGDHQCSIPCNDELLIRFSAFVRYWRKNGSTMRQYTSYS
jgi:prefoldin subunit 5